MTQTAATTQHVPPWHQGPRRWPRYIAIGASVAYLLSMITVAVLLWTASDRWWPATVLLFSPRWTFAFPLVALVPLALVLHRRSLFIVGASALVVAWPVMGFELPLGGATGTPSLRVLTCNIHRQQLDAVTFRAMLDAVRPDVIALQDWSSTHEADLFGDGSWYTRRDGELFLASHFPIASATPITLNEPPKPTFGFRYGAAMQYRLLTPDGPVSIVNLHLSSPHEALSAMRAGAPNFVEQLEFNQHCREGESAAIRQCIARLGEPTIVMGDFNTPRESAIYRANWSSLTNAFSTRGSGFGLTHVSMTSSVRIDHVLFTEGWTAQNCWLEKPTGSPHRPLVVDLARGGQGASAMTSAAP